jgi:hypothetical protein
MHMAGSFLGVFFLVLLVLFVMAAAARQEGHRGTSNVLITACVIVLLVGLGAVVAVIMFINGLSHVNCGVGC